MMNQTKKTEWTVEDLPLDIAVALGIDQIGNVQKALNCLCECHLRRFGRPNHLKPDGSSTYDDILDGLQGPLHDNGSSCPCQLSKEELFSTLFHADDELEDILDQERQAEDADRKKAIELAELNGLEQLDIKSSTWLRIDFEASYNDHKISYSSRNFVWDIHRYDELDNCWILLDMGLDMGLVGDDEFKTEYPITSAVARTIDIVAKDVKQRTCTHPNAERFCPHCGAQTVSYVVESQTSAP